MLNRIPADVRTPSYDRSALSAGVVHIGFGAFHRAHQAPIFEKLIELGDMRWGVVGASLRSTALAETLAAQDGLFSLLVEEDDRRSASVIGTTIGIIAARKDPHRLIEAIASPATQMVTITITEKGYKLDPSSGQLLADDPDVKADVAHLERPATIAGYLAAGLKLRRDRALPPITIASCDNMSDNGRKLSNSVVRVARAQDDRLGDWIERHCTFPNSMVDRIVPATTESDVATAASLLGVVDLATVRTEPFFQWVIENRLTGTAKELERADVQITSDLARWEQAKLRLLNGAHSAMAYLGGLAGIGTVDAFVAYEWGKRFVRLLWDEIETTLTPPPELNLAEYRSALMRRFSNRALCHRLRQIAIDGSQKLPPRLLAPASELISCGKKPDALALAIAAWMQWQSGRDDQDLHFDVDDPLASTTARLVADASNPREYTRALMSLSSIFPAALASDAEFMAIIENHLHNLQRSGARATIEQFVHQSVAI
jgi:fructuronate reductase